MLRRRFRHLLRSAVIGAVLGLFGGIGLAPALDQLFKAFGADLPDSGTVLETRTIVVSLLVGIVITVLAGLQPALRATRVTPLAAWTQAGESSLRLRVENIGQTTLSTAQWSAQLHTAEGVINGTIEQKQIGAGQIDFVLCAAAGSQSVWEISTGAVFLAVSAD